ncbi:MAG: acyl-CoA/acyl-ACP dehydrogenase [Candidatus Latescibacteria bacterium]|nr:acyl-CoA/acyl-ACP dehydrogenase [Candidatus Latescibacterota bacterium]
MDFALNKDQNTLREEIIRFVRKELNNGALERDREQAFPHDLWLKCGEMRLQGLPVPEEYGGRGLDPLSTALALEAFGYGCEDGGLVFSVCAHLLAGVVPVWKYGSEEQKRRYLPGLCNGTLIAANGMTEPGSGSDIFSMSTRAEPDGDGFRINGTKTLVTNDPVADVVVVYTVTGAKKGLSGGLSVFLVERGTPGLQVSQKFEKMGLRTAMMGAMTFEDVYVPASAVLGGVGAGMTIFFNSMGWERVGISASHVGTMRRLVEKGIERARTRVVSGQPIGKHQAVSHKIADMKIRLEAARLLAYKSAWSLGQTRENAMDASITKVFVSESLVKTALDTVQVFGGYGFLTEYEVERTLRDAIGSTLYSGTNEIQRNIIARWLGL